MNIEKGFLLALIAVLGFLAFLMVKPFLAYVLMAPILAFVVMPAHRKLGPRIGKSFSAASLVLLILVAAIFPISLASAAVISDAQDLSRDLNSSELFDAQEIELNIERLTGREIDVSQAVDQAVDRFTSTAFGSVSQLVTILTNFLIGATLMLFVTYYLVKDGESLVDWIISVVPLPEEIEREIQERTRVATWAVIKGHVFVAFAQAILAGIGMAIAGVPNTVFWTFVMILLGFIPVVGSMLIWAPASFYLVAIGKPVSGILLLIYGFTVVSLSDNVVRPLTVDRGADIHPAAIIIGVVGGVYLFGAAGLFIGPIVFGALKSTLSVFHDKYEQL